jgi:hypothetical protein
MMINAIKLRNITLSIFGVLLLVGGIIKGGLWLYHFFQTAPVDQIANFWLAFWLILLVEQLTVACIQIFTYFHDDNHRYDYEEYDCFGNKNPPYESKNCFYYTTWSNVHTINDLIIFMLLWSSIGQGVVWSVNHLYKFGQIKIK